MGKVAILAILALSACTAPRGTFCQIADPIRLSPETIERLTDEEVRDFLTINRTGQRLCGWRP